MEEYSESMKKQMLRSKIVEYEVKSKVVVTQEDVRSYYEEHVDEYGGKEKYHLFNILLKGASFGDQKNKDDVFNAIKMIHDKLNAGEPFEEMARMHSEAPFAEEGGDIGLFEIKELSKQIQEALKKFNKFSDSSDLLVGHNVSFDKRMVIVEGVRNKIMMNVHDTFCTMKNSVELCKIERTLPSGDTYFKYPTLSELHYKLFEKIPKNTHNALIDILICMRCFVKMEFKKDISRINRTIRLMMRDAC